MRVHSALGVGEDVDFNLPHSCVQLYCQLWVAIVESGVGARIHLLPQLGRAGPEAGMVAVVRANHLDLVDADLCVCLRHRCARHSGHHGGKTERDGAHLAKCFF